MSLPPASFSLCVPYNLEFPLVNTLLPSFSSLIYFHVVAFGQPTVSKMVKSMAFYSTSLPALWNMSQSERHWARPHQAGPDQTKQGQEGGSLEDVWMWPPCLQGRRITLALTNCRVSRLLNCYDREVLCFSLTLHFETYSFGPRPRG